MFCRKTYCQYRKNDLEFKDIKELLHYFAQRILFSTWFFFSLFSTIFPFFILQLYLQRNFAYRADLSNTYLDLIDIKN